jgi:hypothetical protein
MWPAPSLAPSCHMVTMITPREQARERDRRPHATQLFATFGTLASGHLGRYAIPDRPGPGNSLAANARFGLMTALGGRRGPAGALYSGPRRKSRGTSGVASMRRPANTLGHVTTTSLALDDHHLTGRVDCTGPHSDRTGINRSGAI